MIVRYDSSVLKKCMKPAGNFFVWGRCVRGVKGMRCRYVCVFVPGYEYKIF